MAREEELRRAQVDLSAVEFSEQLATENPGMYNVKEMRELIERHEVSREAADRAMREDLASMPPEMRQAMKRMLKESDIPDEIWRGIFGEDF